VIENCGQRLTAANIQPGRLSVNGSLYTRQSLL